MQPAHTSGIRRMSSLPCDRHALCSLPLPFVPAFFCSSAPPTARYKGPHRAAHSCTFVLTAYAERLVTTRSASLPATRAHARAQPFRAAHAL
eukprot:6207594-Pleurochrysis_carterae.AAC.1